MLKPKTFMGYLFAVGFVSILGQVVLLRELSVAFYGVELIYTLALGIWLFFGGCGAMIGRRIKSPSFTAINVLFLLLSAGILLDVAFIRSIRVLFSNVAGGYLPLHTQMAALSASLLPIGLMLGLLFQLAARKYISARKSLAVAYAIESIGGMIGGLCGTLFLKFGFQNFLIALLCALFALGSSFLNEETKQGRWFRPAAILLFAILILLLWKAPALDRMMTSWAHPNLVETADSPYSRITVALHDAQVSVFENDALLFDSEGTLAEEFVHLAALQQPNPDRVLVLGGGIEGTIYELLKHSPRAVDYVELNRALLEVVPRNLPPEIQKSLRADNVRIIIEDPRRFLNRALRYDLILVGMPEPTSGQANRFYTEEFFRQCASKLNNGGILAFRLQSSENIWTPQLTRRMVSIYRAAKAVFPEIIVLPGSTNIVIASPDPLTRDAAVLASRLNARKIKARLISANYLRYLYTNDRFQQIAQILETESAPVNTDARPICFQYTVLIWLSKFIPSLKFRDFSLPDWVRDRGILWLIIIGSPAFLLNRAPWYVRRALLTGIAAFAGMVFETIFLLHYQTKNGILYQDIGILLTFFMAGLALGAFTMEKQKYSLHKWMAAAMLLGFVLLSAVIFWGQDSARSAGLPATSGLLAFSGFLVAGIFAYCSLTTPEDQSKAVAPLYSADLIGGCAGSIIASLILAPAAGLAASAFLMAPLAIISILLL